MGIRRNYGYNPKGEVSTGLREKTATPNTPIPGWDHGYDFDQIGNRLTATVNDRISNYIPNAINQYDSRTIPRAFDVIGKANTAATVTVNGNPAIRLDEFFYKELSAGSCPVHVPYSVSATYIRLNTPTPSSFAKAMDDRCPPPSTVSVNQGKPYKLLRRTFGENSVRSATRFCDVCKINDFILL